LLAQVLIYGTLALLLSMVLPSRRLAAMAAGMVMVASYVLSSMAALNEDLALIAQLLPYEYFQGGGRSERDLVHGLADRECVVDLLAWWRFQRRDIRVGGEGS
jgi:hypothetical protein